MNIVPFQDVSASDWDSTCSSSKHAWLFHSHAWIAIETQYFAKQNLSFALLHDGAIVGLQPLYVTDLALGTWTERLVHSGIHRHTGLALLPTLASGLVRSAHNLALRRIFELAEQKQADRVQLNAQTLAPACLDGISSALPLWLESGAFYFGLNFGPQGIVPAPGMSTFCVDQVVDLDVDDDDLLRGFDENCRRAVRKALNASLEFEAGTKCDCMEDYYRLANLAAQRTGETLAPKQYYEDVWNAFGPDHRCAVLFARVGSRRVAGLFLLLDKGAASYLGGVSDPSFLSMRVNDFLHWSSMLWCKRQGLRAYRLGPYFPEAPSEWPIARVARFKTKFGARSVPIVQGSAFRRPERYLDGATRHLKSLCARPGQDVRRGASETE